mgnify:CR=1 FL=1
MTSHKTPRRRVKRRRDIRWLRSNGTPNFSDHIHRVPGDLELIAKKPVATVSPNSPLIKALEIMSSNYRSLVVTQKDYVKGLLLATHMINYLGGGEYFNIVVKRHGYNIFSALEKEPVESIMEREPIIAYTSDKLPDVLEKMVIYNIGVLPVVDEDERIYGILFTFTKQLLHLPIMQNGPMDPKGVFWNAEIPIAYRAARILSP